MWGNPLLFHRENLLKKILKNDKYGHNQLRISTGQNLLKKILKKAF